MITKEQQARLKQSATPQIEAHYTIGGSTETAVHHQIERERSRQYQRGEEIMNKAVDTFRTNMAFKARAGQAKSQFQQANSSDKKKEQLDAFRRAVNVNQKTVER